MRDEWWWPNEVRWTPWLFSVTRQNSEWFEPHSFIEIPQTLFSFYSCWGSAWLISPPARKVYSHPRVVVGPDLMRLVSHQPAVPTGLDWLYTGAGSGVSTVNTTGFVNFSVLISVSVSQVQLCVGVYCLLNKSCLDRQKGRLASSITL